MIMCAGTRESSVSALNAQLTTGRQKYTDIYGFLARRRECATASLSFLLHLIHITSYVPTSTVIRTRVK
ncbi:hypothetical protein WG66_017078 [Moniliophthora roreri]|nr:hypothetical protein WG66_017078 [Moniliophthora roreri]